MRRGFWYNHGTGEIISAMFTRHLRVVMENPEKFGVTSAFINAEFTKTRERHGIEGVARRQILLSVLENSNWVRWRERSNPTEADIREVADEFTGEAALG